jgi:hypothetical protein
MIKDIFRTYVNFYTEGTGGLLPCRDGCKFFIQYKDKCRHKADCNLDISMGRGLYYFWDGEKPTQRSGGDKQKAVVGYRKWKHYESDY